MIRPLIQDTLPAFIFDLSDQLMPDGVSFF